MTRVIYLDSLFVLNFVLDFILVALTADLRGIYCSRRRQAAAAALGAVLAVILYIPSIPTLVGILFRLGSCMAVCGAAFPRERGRDFLRCCGLLFILSAAVAGAVGALILLTAGNAPAAVRNGVVWLVVPVWKQLCAAACCWCLLRMLFHGGSLSGHRSHRVLTIRDEHGEITVRALVDTGNTVLVIEHNLDVIKVADHLIDLGPEGGSGGGSIVVCGTPETVAACPDSYTGQYLKRVLE
jgi:hypothetical protein